VDRLHVSLPQFVQSRRQAFGHPENTEIAWLNLAGLMRMNQELDIPVPHAQVEEETAAVCAASIAPALL
jgi:hypothetical protein